MNREDLLRAVHFDHPERVPVTYHVNMGCWNHYPREALAEMMLAHPALFPSGVPDFARTGEPVPFPPWCTAGKPWIDPWGCRWETSISGCIGAVTRHPLAKWKDLSSFVPPDPEKTTHWGPVDWDHVRAGRKGPIGFFDCLTSGEIGHGHTFLKLIDLLGYEQAILAMVDNDPRLYTVLSMIEAFNLGLVQRFLDVDIDRQHITPSGSPEEVKAHVLDILRLLDDPAGGLILTFGLYPGTAWENAVAMAEVLDEVARGRRG